MRQYGLDASNTSSKNKQKTNSKFKNPEFLEMFTEFLLQCAKTLRSHEMYVSFFQKSLMEINFVFHDFTANFIKS